MFQCVAIAPCAVEKPLPTQNRAIGQIQPEVFPQVASGTLPAAGKSRENSQKLAHQENIDVLKMNSASYWQHFPGFSPQDITALHPEQGTIHPAPCLPPRLSQRLSAPPAWLFRKLAKARKRLRPPNCHLQNSGS